VKGCFQIHPADNVAVLLQNCAAGPLRVVGAKVMIIELPASIALGHKVATADLAPGSFVIKFGVPIGVATAPIKVGDWVHLHNCRSQLDERSSTLDTQTGATNDMTYE
jgi:hypothetical protein